MQPEKKHGFPYETPYEEKRRLRLERGEPEPQSDSPFTPIFVNVRSVEPVVSLTPAEQAQHQMMTCCPVYRMPEELTLAQGQSVLYELSIKKGGDM